MERKLLNDMIWSVLNAKFKKDAKEAFKAVEDAGYTIYKNGSGYWTVCNKATNRYINLGDRGWKYHTQLVIQHGPYVSHQHRLTHEECNADSIAFDFVGCLEKPINQTWYDLQNKETDWNKLTAVKKWDDIKFQMRMAKSYENDIERTKKEIERLQKQLISYTETKCRYESQAKMLKAQYGLA